MGDERYLVVPICWVCFESYMLRCFVGGGVLDAEDFNRLLSMTGQAGR